MKVKLHIVDKLFVGDQYSTNVWVSERAATFLTKHGKKHEEEVQRFLKKLERYATSGFEHHQGTKSPIRHEWNQVFRIGHGESLLRLIGFYEAGARTSFIAIDGFNKRGQDLTHAQRGRINEVSKVRQEQRWKKRAP